MKNIVSIIDILEKWTTPKGTRKILVTLFIMSLQIMIYKVVYMTGGAKYSYAQAMYIPLILGSLFFGVMGGFVFGLSSGLILGPFMPLDTVTMEMQDMINWNYRLGFYILIGLITGVIMEFLISTIKRLNKLSFYNHFTNLPNARYFENMRIKEDTPGYFFIIEMNNYSQILYNLGYEFSMKLIKEFSREVSNILKTYGETQVFHLQDNKFGVLVKQTNEKEISKKFLKLGQMSIKVDGIEVHPYIFIGAARCEKDSCDLLKKAEYARLFAKKNLRNYHMYIPELSSKIDSNFKLFEEFPRAISNKEFFLCYHPKFEVSTGMVKDAEVLIRWMHPKRGIVGPNEFIPYLETTTFITKITKWVLRQSLKSLNIMEKAGIDIKLSINVPLKILEDPEFIGYLKELRQLGYPLKKIEFEILERDCVEDFKKISDIMNSIKKMGIKFSLDDFGTGYSALSYVKKLPFDKIKLDMMFIKDLEKSRENMDIVKSAIDMAHHMGITVVAEGVESEDILDMLKQLKCDYAQGFYFNHPLNQGDFIKWYHSNENTKFFQKIPS